MDPKWVDASSTSRRYVVDYYDICTAYNEDQEENITYGTEEEDIIDIITDGVQDGEEDVQADEAEQIIDSGKDDDQSPLNTPPFSDIVDQPAPVVPPPTALTNPADRSTRHAGTTTGPTDSAVPTRQLMRQSPFLKKAG